MTRFFVSVKSCLLLEAFVAERTNLVSLVRMNQAMFDQVLIGCKVCSTDVAAIGPDVQMDVIEVLLQTAPPLLKMKRLLASRHRADKLLLPVQHPVPQHLGVGGEPLAALVADVGLDLAGVSVHPPLVLLQVILGHLRTTDLAADLLVILHPKVGLPLVSLKVLCVVKGHLALHTLLDDVMIEEPVSLQGGVGGDAIITIGTKLKFWNPSDISFLSHFVNPSVVFVSDHVFKGAWTKITKDQTLRRHLDRCLPSLILFDLPRLLGFYFW